MHEYPLIRCLVVVLKQFLIYHNLLESFNGGISSYCLILLILSYLQVSLLRLLWLLLSWWAVMYHLVVVVVVQWRLQFIRYSLSARCRSTCCCGCNDIPVVVVVSCSSHSCSGQSCSSRLAEASVHTASSCWFSAFAGQLLVVVVVVVVMMSL